MGCWGAALRRRTGGCAGCGGWGGWFGLGWGGWAGGQILTQHGNVARQVVDDRRAEVCGRRKPLNDPRNNQHNPRYANYWVPLTHKRCINPNPQQFSTGGKMKF